MQAVCRWVFIACVAAIVSAHCREDNFRGRVLRERAVACSHNRKRSRSWDLRPTALQQAATGWGRWVAYLHCEPITQLSGDQAELQSAIANCTPCHCLRGLGGGVRLIFLHYIRGYVGATCHSDKNDMRH